MKKIAIIGCGAAGMMAALTAAQNGSEVTIFEKNDKPGKKIYITGKGRCNVTNACDVNDFFQNIRRNSKFLYSAVYSYDNTAVMEFFENNNCPLKIERGERVFPVSDHSSDIIRALVRALEKEKVTIEYDSEITDIICEEDEVKGLVINGKEKKHFDRVIICTGGVSYKTTGSTGDGYKFAKKTGHEIIEEEPALVPFEVKEDWCRDLQGLSLRNVGLRMENIPEESGKNEAEKGKAKKAKKNKPLYEGFGEMLFTHFGVSGPLILTASCYYKKGLKCKLYIDLKPALTPEQLDKRILREFESGMNKQFKNSIGSLFPSKLVPVMLKLSGIDPDKTVNDVSREERLSFVELIKNLPLTVTGTRGFQEAIITAGGVSVKDINPSTMESKHIKGLFFAGEVIDTHAVTGGFNLQIAWSTGHLAGESACFD
ncbi:MAG: NAD(P)/FAD-dependent oxidoreductase [Butyrivibrio sp.]|nr:NAD(P)/FAD-dependent oxidoreductase [Butyrivibrio sp.]